MSETKHAAQAFAESISALATAEIKTALDKTQKRCDELIATTEDKVSKIKSNCMSVKINDLPERKLKQRASKYLPLLLKRAAIRKWSLLVGPAGCGKTTIAHQVAESMGLDFGHLCLTAGASETWLFGRQTPNGFVEGNFSKLYRNGGVFLLDEYDAADANLLLSINTALENGHMYNPISGENLTRHKDFVAIAAANTNGKGSNHVYTGRSRQDAAALERFLPIEIDYDEDLEDDLLSHDEYKKFLFELRKEIRKAQSDEIISTRAFINAELQMSVGIPVEDIFAAMVFNWSDSAKEIAKRVYKKYDFTTIKVKAPEIPIPAAEPETTQEPEKRGRGRPTGWRKYKEPEKPDGTADLAAEIERLKAENARLNAPPVNTPLKADNAEMYERFNRGVR